MTNIKFRILNIILVILAMVGLTDAGYLTVNLGYGWVDIYLVLALFAGFCTKGLVPVLLAIGLNLNKYICCKYADAYSIQEDTTFRSINDVL